ncbi:phage portal protein [Sphingomonas cynarae]|uniref:phage portal protein n=1 Tax=Sphingomonas cynarae TaxID=930197 RepID=UPI0031D17887
MPVPEITSGATIQEWGEFWGQGGDAVALPIVTIDTALQVPAVLGAVMFLSRTLAALPLHAYRTAEGETEKADGELQMLLNEAPNPEWSSFQFRQYFWQQVFTGGRGMAWIERNGTRPVAIWPLDPTKTTIRREAGRKIYRFDGRDYPARDIIDVPFALKPNQVDAYGPIYTCRQAIGLAIAMNNFASGFFAGGGVPPLALEGPLPTGPEALKRAYADIRRAIDLARKTGQSFFGMPPGHTLKAVGTDPDKGQMGDARLFQIQEIARGYNLPPVFLQDLSKGTFSNTEQQDLQLVKHNIGQWARAFEDELNLKLFGQRRRSRRVKHNLDGLQRGDFKSRIDGLARAIQTAQLTPDEARGIEDRAAYPDGVGARPLVQGATVPLGSQPLLPTPSTGNEGDDQAVTEA